MTTVRTALLAGTAAVLLAGTAGLALAQSPSDHVLTIQLPGGGIEQIHYSGAVPPHVVLMPDAGALPAMMAPGPAFWASPFATLDRITAQMDRETDALLQQAEVMARQPLPTPDQMLRVQFGTLPRGAESYSYVATFTGNGVCARSVTISSEGNGLKPQVVSHVSGDCGPGQGAVQPATVTPAHRLPGTIQVRATQPLYAGLIHKVSAWQQ